VIALGRELGLILKNSLITRCRRTNQITKKEDGSNGLKQDKPIVGWGHEKGRFFPIPFWLSLSYTFRKVDHLGALTRAFRNVSRRKMRTLLVIVALGFSMAIMISIPSGIIANQESTQSLTERFSSTITTMQEEINKTSTLIECRTSSGQGGFSGFQFGRPPQGSEQAVFINETEVNEIRSIEGVKDVVQFLQTSSNETTSETINGPGGRNFTISRPLYTITGVCLNSSFIENYSILPTNITAGRSLQEGDSGVLLMSSNLTDYFGVEVGGRVEINGEDFTVVGVYDQASQGFSGVRTVYMNISDAQMATGNAGNVSMLDVYAQDTSDVDGIATAIEAVYSELTVTTYKDRLSQLQNMQTTYNETLTSAESTLSQTQSVATQEIVVAVVAASLIILFVMLYTVRERTREIGTLKAIGFSNWNVMSQFMLEGILLSLVAGIVGIGIGSVGAPVLSGLLLPSINPFGSSGRSQFNPTQADFGAIGSNIASASLTPQLMLLALGAAILLGALGSLYPAWRASRTRPAEAMRYE
jgi:putative ABC transport system permease protein